MIYVIYYNGCFYKIKEGKHIKLYNSTQNNLISDNVNVAENFFSRAIGLIEKKSFPDAQALVIKPCNSIHTFFMKFPIDVLFVNKNNKIISIYENVKPNRILPVHFNSKLVVELASGQIRVNNICLGDIIRIESE